MSAVLRELLHNPLNWLLVFVPAVLAVYAIFGVTLYLLPN
jgi:hypothetical protein